MTFSILRFFFSCSYFLVIPHPWLTCEEFVVLEKNRMLMTSFFFVQVRFFSIYLLKGGKTGIQNWVLWSIDWYPVASRSMVSGFSGLTEFMVSCCITKPLAINVWRGVPGSPRSEINYRSKCITELASYYTHCSISVTLTEQFITRARTEWVFREHSCKLNILIPLRDV